MNIPSPHLMRSALLLAIVAIIGTSILSLVNTMTKSRIAQQQEKAVLDQLNQVLPSNEYDNELHKDAIEIIDAGFFRHDSPVKIYRARMGSRPVAVVMNLVAPDGYNGDIRLLVAIRASGEIVGVRVVTHKETPGLGDPIERSRSDWVLGFDKRSLDNPNRSGWAVKRDGGVFEQFTGATITPRAVVEAVERALGYFSIHRDSLFEQQTTEATDANID